MTPRRHASRTLAPRLLALLLGVLGLHVRVAAAEPAATLVMPFDASAGNVSFLVASHPARAAGGVRTHWSFWDESCAPLHSAIVCLPPDGSVIVDPTAVPASDGGTRDLRGRRGFVTVTAYQAAAGCDPGDTRRGTLAGAALIGSFTLADVDAGVSFGGPALALAADPSAAFVELGAADDDDPALHQAALRLQSFDPADLDVSRVILLALAERAGSGAFRATEPGPAVEGRATVRAAVRFADRNGASIALPDASLGCATFTSLRRDHAATLLPPGGPGDLVASGGFLTFESPRIGDSPLGRQTWLAGFHAQGVGSFGVLALGDAELAVRGVPTPAPTAASPSPTPRPSLTPTPRPSGAASPTPVASATPRPTASSISPTATPVRTATPDPGPTPPPGATPSPAPSDGATPTPTSAQPTPATSPTAPPSVTSNPTVTPRPSPTPTAASTASTPTPAPTATPSTTAAPGCSTLTVEVRTTYGASDPGDVSGVAATLTYPPSVSIPGTGSDPSVTARVGNVSGVSGLFQATDMETQLRAGLISISTGIPAGPFVRVQFDCTGGAAPPASAFGCTLEASTLEGTLLLAAACTTEIVS